MTDSQAGGQGVSKRPTEQPRNKCHACNHCEAKVSNNRVNMVRIRETEITKRG